VHIFDYTTITHHPLLLQGGGFPISGQAKTVQRFLAGLDLEPVASRSDRGMAVLAKASALYSHSARLASGIDAHKSCTVDQCIVGGNDRSFTMEAAHAMLYADMYRHYKVMQRFLEGLLSLEGTYATAKHSPGAQSALYSALTLTHGAMIRLCSASVEADIPAKELRVRHACEVVHLMELYTESEIKLNPLITVSGAKCSGMRSTLTLK
jgi:hypothetical protein